MYFGFATMKDRRGDSESTILSSARPPPNNFGTEKHIIVDHERSQVHLVSSPVATSEVPVPVLSGLQLLNSAGLFTDPRLHAQLIASIHQIANPSVRFQIPIIPLTVQMANTPLYPSSVQVSTHLQAPTITIPTHVTTSQALNGPRYDLLSSWIEQDFMNSVNAASQSPGTRNGKSSPLTMPTETTTTSNVSTLRKNNGSKKGNNEKDNKEKNGSRKKRQTNNLPDIANKNKRNKLEIPPIIPTPPLIVSPLPLDQRRQFTHSNGLKVNNNSVQMTDLSLTNSTTPAYSKTKAEKATKKRKYVKKEKVVAEIADIKQQPEIDDNNRHSQSNFNNNDVNINNQNKYNPNKVFSCPICNRTFGYKHVLQNHERTHTGEKPFECTICSKKFTRDHHLKTHMRLHTGEKPYQCSHCDRQFVQVANLRRHLRVHTGEKPYSCELCASKFSDSNQLKAHNLIHKGEKPHNCISCNRIFRRRHHLTSHKCTNNNNAAFKNELDSVLEDQSDFLPNISSPLSSFTATAAASSSSSSSKGSTTSSNNSNSSGKRERKSRETRRIIRLDGLPVSTISTKSPSKNPFLPIPPVQTHAQDLSLVHRNGIEIPQAPRHFSGSHSSVSTSLSPSPPTSGGSHHDSLFAYSVSSGISPRPGFTSSDDEQRGSSITPPTSRGSNVKESEKTV